MWSFADKINARRSISFLEKLRLVQIFREYQKNDSAVPAGWRFSGYDRVGGELMSARSP